MIYQKQDVPSIVRQNNEKCFFFVKNLYFLNYNVITLLVYFDVLYLLVVSCFLCQFLFII